MVSTPVNTPPSPWAHPAFLDSTEKQQRFIRAYLARTDANASAAWRDAGLGGKNERVAACQLLKKLQPRVEQLRPVYDKYQRYLLEHAIAVEQGAAPAVAAVQRIVPPTLTKKELGYIFSQIAQGKDPNPPQNGSYDYDENAVPVYRHPLIIRAQDVLMAGKALMELKGWAKSKMQIEGNAKKPLTVEHRLKGKSTEEIQAELAELRARNSVDVPRLVAIKSTNVEES